MPSKWAVKNKLKWSVKPATGCRVFGCVQHDDYPACGWCGAEIYSAEFVQVPIAPVRAWRRAVAGVTRAARWFRPARCAECGRLLWNRRWWNCCSPECSNNFMPF